MVQALPCQPGRQWRFVYLCSAQPSSHAADGFISSLTVINEGNLPCPPGAVVELFDLRGIFPMRATQIILPEVPIGPTHSVKLLFSILDESLVVPGPHPPQAQRSSLIKSFPSPSKGPPRTSFHSKLDPSSEGLPSTFPTWRFTSRWDPQSSCAALSLNDFSPLAFSSHLLSLPA